MSAPEELEMSTTRSSEEAIEPAGQPDLKTSVSHDDHQEHLDHTEEDMCSQCSDSDSDYDEYEYCDCMLDHAQQAIPGAPGKRGIIPYKAVYDTQDEARKRGYWIPGVGVSAKIISVERDTSAHLFSQFVYTIALEHGPYKWTVQKRYGDFSHLNNRLMAHRAAERIRVPVRNIRDRQRRAHDAIEEAIDDTFEQFGYDYIPEHKENCPYNRRAGGIHHNRNTQTLSRSTEGVDEIDIGPAKTANGETSAVPPSPLPQGEKTSPYDPKISTVEAADANGEDVADGGIISKSDKGNKGKKRARKHHHLPRFPFLPDSVLTAGHVNARRGLLEAWLQAVLHIPLNRNHHETAEFFEVSRFSFVNQLGGKELEGFVKKRPGGRRVYSGYKAFCLAHCAKWGKRWLILKDSCVCYMGPREEMIHSVLFFDKEFHVKAGGKEVEGMDRGLMICNLQRELLLKCETPKQAEAWRKAIEDVSKRGPGKVWLEPHRFGSTYPIREHSYAQWFCDGKSFMEQAASLMELAREEIFIANWWLSPEIYMKRPMTEGNRWRLDEILKRKAEQGVKIFVLLFKEMEMALGINSLYSKRTLQKLHPTNVKVLRHPDHLPGVGTFLWAHHEKLICIDQTVAFVGGVDLCYGRWDDNQHKLIDLGSVQFQNVNPLAGQERTLLSGMRAVAAASTAIQLTVDEDSDEREQEVSLSKKFHDLRNPPVHGKVNDEVDHRATDQPETSNAHKKESGAPKSPDTQKKKPDAPKSPSAFKKKSDAAGTSEPKTKKKTHFQAVASSMTRDGEKKRSSSDSVYEPDSAEGAKGDKSAHPNQSVPEERGRLKKFVKKNIMRSTSLEPPKEMLQNAGPPLRLLSTAVTKMDIGEAVERYKAYVESGRAEKEKRECDTPPPEEQKKGKLKKAISHWKSSRAKRRWQEIAKEEEGTVHGKEYMDGWLRLQAEDVDESDMVGSGKIWLGKDYCNFVAKDFVDLDMPYHDFIDRSVTPRMPWHDVHVVTYGAAARDVARHFIQRWNAVKTEKVKDDDDYPHLVPKSYDNVKVPRVFRSLSQRCNVQVLRSASSWSAAINTTEDSIQQAYLSMIANAQHYVYIENQFVISMIGSSEVHNEISKVLCDRITRAYEQKETFRVYITLPLLPGFEGQIGASGGSALVTVLHWTYLSLSRGPHSLLENLKKKVPDPFEYIQFCSLRTCEELCGRLLTELIYVHSKMLIVDDTHCLIGSANINDRSQMGNRDSEVALFINDTEFEDSKMNGKPYKAGKFSAGLRKHLMREHLGMLKDDATTNAKDAKGMEGVGDNNPGIDVSDPVIDTFFFDVWKATAEKNTELFEKVFRVFPTNLVETFEQLSAWNNQIPMAQYNKVQAEAELTGLRGYLVSFPLYFLKDANLAPSITTKEGLAPNALFT